MNGIEILLPHILWLIGIILAGSVVGIVAVWKGATKKSAEAYRYGTSAVLLLVYLLIAFR
ncbi:hypothetical protein GCM10009123_09280 [Kangiella japonica]|uniref:PEP-CTERM protein-sorting domain-containing protein n=1 Tax=Kangiella japonica TaxID=647384 RepID=A0ABN0SWM9_9GAMM